MSTSLCQAVVDKCTNLGLKLTRRGNKLSLNKKFIVLKPFPWRLCVKVCGGTGRPSPCNWTVGALLPFSPLRGYVLDMVPARERTPVTQAELNQMRQIYDEAMLPGHLLRSDDMVD